MLDLGTDTSSSRFTYQIKDGHVQCRTFPQGSPVWTVVSFDRAIVITVIFVKFNVVRDELSFLHCDKSKAG